MRIERLDSVNSFLDTAGPFLVAREAEHNLPLGVAGTLRDHPEIYPDPPYLAVVRRGRAVVLAALRTPPFNLVLSEADDPRAVDLVVDDVAAVDRDLPGVLGAKPAAARFAARWASTVGRKAELETAMRIFRLIHLVPPRLPSGTWRLAEPADHALLVRWILEFQAEATPGAPTPRDLDLTVRRWIERIGRTMYLWIADARPVSMVGAGSPTPNGIRIGPVYTPPADRGRGYATALTAAASQDQLDAGFRFCFLFTDLANPTSNRIYQSIGYEAVSDVDEYRFGG